MQHTTRRPPCATLGELLAQRCTGAGADATFLVSWREDKREELDVDAQSHLEAYSALAQEEQRLLASLSKWQTVQDDAFTQLDTVIGKGAENLRQLESDHGGARPPARGGWGEDDVPS